MNGRLSVFTSRLRKCLFLRLVANGLGQAAAAVAVALLVRETFDVLIRHGRSHGRWEGLAIAAGFLAAAAAGAALRLRERIDAERMGQSYAHHVRLRLFDHLSRLAPRSLQQRSRGAVVLRFVGDLNALKRWISLGLSRLTVAGFTTVGALGVLAVINPVLTLGAAGAIGAAALAFLCLGGQLRESAREGRRRRSYLAANMNEKVATIAVVQIFGQSARERRRVRRQSRRLSDAMVLRAEKIGQLRAITHGTAILATATVLLLGAAQVAAGTATAGTVAAAMTMVHLLVSSLRSLGRVQEYRQDAHVSIEKIRQFLDSHELVQQRPQAVELAPGPGRLEFLNVGLGDILEAVSVTAEAGTRVAVTGRNGSGKSTLLWLAARLIDPDKGLIRIDGQDLAGCRLDSLRRAVGMVSPDLPLLRGKLLKNLRYRWPDAPEEELARVRQMCAVDDVIDVLPRGEQTRIIEEGLNLSLGQRQRIALARALLGEPRLLLLDEADAHLDTSAGQILDSVLAAYRGTVLMVTHDPKRLASADVVWRIENGRLTEEAPDPVVRPNLKLVGAGEARSGKAAPLVPGRIQHRILSGDGRSAYFVYMPLQPAEPMPLLVLVHGISRRAKEQVRMFSAHAEAQGCMLVAPVYDAVRFAGYQRLGGLRGERADRVLEHILAEVERLRGGTFPRFHIFGYSGGAQFAHRFAMAYPARVDRLAAAAAGWYTLPDAHRRFPMGLQPHPRLDDLRFDLKKILRVPACVLVGAEDTAMDPNLRQSEKINRRQGATRVERAGRWVRAMSSAAAARRLDTPFRLEIMPGCGHSFSQCMCKGNMGARVFAFLFGPGREQTIISREPDRAVPGVT